MNTPDFFVSFSLPVSAGAGFEPFTLGSGVPCSTTGQNYLVLLNNYKIQCVAIWWKEDKPLWVFFLGCRNLTLRGGWDRITRDSSALVKPHLHERFNGPTRIAFFEAYQLLPWPWKGNIYWYVTPMAKLLGRKNASKNARKNASKKRTCKWFLTS